ncbi:penicillin-binding protein activator [Alteromonas sp. a30]|uniref:penicillin-binding protein activator n=1 Tax=Alteromonas sp. a30 TaxID=2730917 RepID=UPI00227E0D43|nr:penicillin-binding protein activator [Alteromonas sp. a30]MCY7294798.1 penicillin-binding protein activator [Alteromonas sp. a30]
MIFSPSNGSTRVHAPQKQGVNTLFSRLKRGLVYSLFAMVIASCAAPPKRQGTQTPEPQQTVASRAEPDSYRDYIEQAKTAESREQVNLLLQAAQLVSKEDCRKSVIILEHLAPHIQEPLHRNQSNLITAECLWQQGNVERAEKLANTLTPTPAFSERVFGLKANILAHKQQWLKAAYNLAQQTNVNEEDIWAMLNALSTDEVKTSLEHASLLAPQLKLQLIQRQYATQPERLNFAWEEWKRAHSWHTFTQTPPLSLQRLLSASPYAPKRLGVILPLSGRLAAQGETIKEGILAAYFAQQEHNHLTNNSNPLAEIIFIDSQTQPDTISAQLSGLDFVLGPLLKENINKFQPYIQSPWLALNFLDEPVSAEEEATLLSRYYFALSPEDEGIQMANHLFQQQYRKPLIIKASNSSTQRMADAFIQQWKHLSGNPQASIEEVPFTDTKSMRNGISNMLEISNSKQRIKEVEALVLKEVHSFERNRRDADAIIVFANATQTELITPFIEANTSPFSPILPIYASSRSHSTNKNLNSFRDLRNLIFLDIPWMLPTDSSLPLKETSQLLWPERRDGDQRLFAMGFDAYNVIRHLKALKYLNQYQYQGLTGKVYMDENNQLRRELLWGQIKDEKVVKYTK